MQFTLNRWEREQFMILLDRDLEKNKKQIEDLEKQVAAIRVHLIQGSSLPPALRWKKKEDVKTRALCARLRKANDDENAKG